MARRRGKFRGKKNRFRKAKIGKARKLAKAARNLLRKCGIRM